MRLRVEIEDGDLEGDRALERSMERLARVENVSDQKYILGLKP